MTKFNLGDKVKVISNYIPLTMLHGEFVNAKIGEIGIVHSYVEGSVKVLFGDLRGIYFTEDMLDITE